MGSKVTDLPKVEGWDYLYPANEPSQRRYQRVTSDHPVSEIIIHDNSSDVLLMMEHFDRGIGRISEQLHKHDKKGTKERKLLMDKIDSLEKENAYYRRQMTSIYSPEKLQTRSTLICVVFLFFLCLSIFFDIQIVHPILSSTVSFTSFVFLLMSFLIKKEKSS
ncbi:MAG: hypothetical protein HUN04_14740 [Desulfobacter sp.]|nr:MAG: hypothetical protein HUN04_14740 [Desulfobacter sp.]